VVAERERVCEALRSAGVAGVDDFGRFVNNTNYFAPSRFDDDAATPILLRFLLDLTDAKVVATVARHLQHGRIGPRGFDVVLDAFRRWATDSSEAGWVLGHTLTRAADETKGELMIDLASDSRYGRSRQMIVYALWRWRATAPVEPALRVLIRDPDVSLQAISALGRVVGKAAMVPVLEDLAAHAGNPTVQEQANRQLRKIRQKLTK
jgi:hypothetical protein